MPVMEYLWKITQIHLLNNSWMVFCGREVARKDKNDPHFFLFEESDHEDITGTMRNAFLANLLKNYMDLILKNRRKRHLKPSHWIINLQLLQLLSNFHTKRIILKSIWPTFTSNQFTYSPEKLINPATIPVFSIFFSVIFFLSCDATSKMFSLVSLLG